MSKTKTFKLIVKSSESCLEVLRYLDKNILDVNKLGARVQCEKINPDDLDKEVIAALKKKGITRLPTLIAPDGVIFIGRVKIINLFNKNLVGNETATQISGIDEFGSNPDMNNFWMKELYDGVDANGRPIIPKDLNDEKESDYADIERRMRLANRNIPTHRRADEEEEQDTFATPIRHHGRTHEPDDNVGDIDYEPPKTGRGRNRKKITADNRNLGPDDMDQKMMDAWMDNNEQTVGIT